MTPASFLALSATVFVAALTPGPAVTAIVARAIADGPRPALAINAGVITGDLVFLALAVGGMTVAAHSLGELFTALKVLGALYLTWQGVKLWRARPRIASGGTAGHESHFWRNYGAGLLLMMGHVQAMLFYAALLPGFVDLTAMRWPDLLLLAVMLVVVIGGVHTAYALAASRARTFFTNERALRILNRIAGTLMFVAAALVATRV